MKVLVTGAGGFIGSAVCVELLARGHIVVGVDAFVEILYPNTVKERRIRGLRASENFSFHQVDLRTSELEPLLEDIDCVINEAALPGLVPSWTHCHDYFECNTIALARLLSVMTERTNAFLVHASTSSVYGAIAEGDETSKLAPVSPYGASKLAAENIIQSYRNSFGLRSTVLRYFSVFGPGQRPDMAYSIFCTRLMKGLPIHITGDGRQQRSNTYISDAARATVLAAEQQHDGSIMNIAGGSSIRLVEALQVLSDELGSQPQIEYAPPRPGDQERTHGDASRAREILGWLPETEVEIGLRAQARAAAENISRPKE